MFTVCPKCALTLVVTAADLGAAQGYVRCGRCSNIFDATAALVKAPRTTPTPAPPSTQPESAPVSDPERRRAANDELEVDPVTANVEDIFAEPQIGDDDPTGTFEAIAIESEADEMEEELRSLVQRLEAREAAARSAAVVSGSAAARAPSLPSLESRTASDSPENAAAVIPLSAGVTEWSELLDGDPPKARRADVHASVWLTGIVVLALALAAQVVHRHRSELVMNPRLSGPLTKIYGAMGLSVEPHWDVHAYEVHQLGANMGGARDENTLVVRASVKNSAPQAQPLPLLRVSVLDRFGNPIMARDVTPPSYLPRGIATNKPLQAGQRVDAEMRFADPGRDAVGFEIDACLASRDGSVACANPR